MKKEVLISAGIIVLAFVGGYFYGKKTEKKSNAIGDGDFKAGNYEKAWS